jgi:hypothetical protein
MAKASSFITDIPVGYVGLDEALPRIAVPDAAFATWLAGCISPLPGIPVERAWSTRDMAISLLATALRSANLVALVRDPVSGELFRLTASDWCNLGLWRDTIIGGVVQASIGEAIERHNGRRVLLEASAFEAWRGQVPELHHHLQAVDPVVASPEIGTPSLATAVSWTGTEKTSVTEPAISELPAESSIVPKPKAPKKPKEWIVEKFVANKAALTRMSITDASKELAQQMPQAVKDGDCSKALKPRGVERWLRSKKLFPPTK